MSFKAARSFGELNTIHEETELHTSPQLGLRACGINDFANSEISPLPEQDHQSSSTISDRETFSHNAIADRLKNIPGFETYSYHGSDSSNSHNNVTQTIPQRTSVLESPELVAVQSANIPYGSEIFHARDELKTLSRGRTELITLQTQFDTSNRKIARARRVFVSEVDQLRNLLKCIEGTELIRESLTRTLCSLKSSDEEIGREEHASTELAQRLIQTQWNVKAAEDSLYAKFSGGARPEDSDAADEDQQFEKRLTTLSTKFPPAAGTQSSSNENQNLEGVFSDTAAHPAPQTNFSTPPASHPAPLNDQFAKLNSGYSADATKSEAKPQISKEQLTADKLNLVTTGSWLIDQNPTKQTSSMFSAQLSVLELQERDVVANVSAPVAIPQTNTTPTLQALETARRRDFLLLLGYDIHQLDNAMSKIKKSDHLVGPFKFRGLVDIDVQSVHTSQYIAMWGRDMAQNASLESSRLLHYAKEDVSNLVKSSNPLVRLVLDVRNLEVPLGNMKASEQPFMAVRQTHLAEGLDEILSLNSLQVNAPSEVASERPHLTSQPSELQSKYS